MSIANPSIYSSTTIISKSFLNGLIGNLAVVMPGVITPAKKPVILGSIAWSS